MQKNVLEEAVLHEVIGRVESLRPDTPRQWGKMDVAQMLAHLTLPLKNGLGELKARSVYFPVVSPLIKRYLMAGGSFMKGNTPTMGEFLIKEQKDFDREKMVFLDHLHRFVEVGRENNLSKHPFYGTMTGDEWGITSYSHLDHHLRQFGV